MFVCALTSSVQDNIIIGAAKQGNKLIAYRTKRDANENCSRRYRTESDYTMTRRIRNVLYIILTIALVLSVFTVDIPAASAGIARTGTVNTQGTNLREEPSTASDVIGTMNLGEEVSVIEKLELGWYKIKYQEITGYTRADFIDVMITGLNYSAVILEDVDMLKDIDASSGVVVNLAAETQVTITGMYGSFYIIRVDSKSGYVPKTSVHKHRIISISLSAELNSSGVNFRSEPSTSGEIIAVLSKGTKVTAKSIHDKWIKVSYNGKLGFISGEFITYSLPANSHMTTLSFGMQAQAVKVVQMALKRKGFYYNSADGIYGSGTKKAVAKFQASVNLAADGIAGPQTLLVLLGTDAANSLWNNFRSEMEPIQPKKNGRVWLSDWFGNMEDTVVRYTAYEVIDVRTGIHWKMQRFGGVTALWHADVEPMTKADTEAMTKAWGGELNPTRRPVWIKIDGEYYAAGLMGYVHGSGTINDNGMDGQVCMHFRGSKIHSSGHIDEAQQACITEAFARADKLDAYIKAGKV